EDTVSIEMRPGFKDHTCSKARLVSLAKDVELEQVFEDDVQRRAPAAAARRQVPKNCGPSLGRPCHRTEGQVALQAIPARIAKQALHRSRTPKATRNRLDRA